jgi:hypothetical protein
MRWATVRSTSSPMSWPRLSLIWRKRSRSTSSSAKPSPARRDAGRCVQHALGQAAAVGQAGQRVGGGQLLDALVGRQLARQVAEAVHAPGRTAALPQRAAHAFEHLAGVQLDLFGAAQQRGVLDGAEPALVGVQVGHAAPHPVVHLGVVAAVEHRLGDAPHLREAAVERTDAPGQVGDQDAVGGGFQRGAQFGQRGVVLVAGALFGAAVAQGHQHVVGRRLVVAGQRRDAAFDMAQPAVGAAQHAVGPQRGRRCVGCGRQFVPPADVLGRGQQLGGRAVQQLVARRPSSSAAAGWRPPRGDRPAPPPRRPAAGRRAGPTRR